jgi:hypothetical protein
MSEKSTPKHEAAKRSQSAPEPNTETKAALIKAGAEVAAGRVDKMDSQGTRPKPKPTMSLLTPEVLVTYAMNEEVERRSEMQYREAALGAFGTRRSHSNLSITSFCDKTSILRHYHSDPCLASLGILT